MGKPAGDWLWHAHWRIGVFPYYQVMVSTDGFGRLCFSPACNHCFRWHFGRVYPVRSGRQHGSCLLYTSGFENADDHRFIQSMAKKYGLYFSRPGNGICHQVHLERLGKPGKTLIGSDSHTPTGGGIGMLAMGAGGLDVAVAMGGGAYYITCLLYTSHGALHGETDRGFI